MLADNLEKTLENLRVRAKRKREEVERHLDVSFYTSCRNMWAAVRRDARSEALLDHPSTRGRWRAVDAALADYSYQRTADFVAAVRDNIDATLSAMKSEKRRAEARKAEVAIEEAFVRELGVPEPSVRRILELVRHVKQSDPTKAKILAIIAQYESEGKLRPAEWNRACQRRVLLVLEQHAAAAARHTASAPHRPVAMKRPPSTSAAAPAGPSSAAGQRPQHSSHTHAPAPALVEDDVPFHTEEAPAATALDPVPQNLHAGTVSLDQLSPVHVEAEDAD